MSRSARSGLFVLRISRPRSLPWADLLLTRWAGTPVYGRLQVIAIFHWSSASHLSIIFHALSPARCQAAISSFSSCGVSAGCNTKLTYAPSCNSLPDCGTTTPFLTTLGTILLSVDMIESAGMISPPGTGIGYATRAFGFPSIVGCKGLHW